MYAVHSQIFEMRKTEESVLVYRLQVIGGEEAAQTWLKMLAIFKMINVTMERKHELKITPPPKNQTLT